LAALEKLVKSNVIDRDQYVVVVSTAHGLKFVDQKVKYHQMELEGIEAMHANPPIALPARYETVRDEMHRQIERRSTS
jgi:threonine synthase